MLEKSYNAPEREPEIAAKWQEKNLFACHPESQKPAFSIVIPPPNVTGNLHIGHALNYTLQDVMCRFKRMMGFDVLWQPGTDHAGIATQMVVERLLAKEGISRHDLGRKKFLERVWEWKKKSGGQIVHQLKRLGSSCDWSCERFTMDEGLSRAVRKIFVKMYKDGLIYKDKRLVNWDSKLQTAISDLEVVQKETVGKMWYFKYPVEKNPDEFIMVGTTRPETLFGDTAVAVSAEDERYQHLIGQNVLIPIINKPIPVVADEHADPTKGTGAVKITPAHDFNDFEVGKRHNLPLVNLLDQYAHLNENVPEKYRGMTPLEARPLVLEEIKNLGLYDHEEANPMTIPHGDRSDVVIEPWLTDQWFVNAKKLAVAAMEAVKAGQTQFVPKTWEKTYFEWMNNIQPWCISRQLWWGHQVPVWYGPDKSVFCEETEEEALAVAEKHYGKKVELIRDTDVLDTWFSSGLWAFSTLGWPDETEHLKRYYPTSVLITGFDIIFYWVARMMMMSMYAMKEVPFRHIHLHGLVRDEKGQKMSKSKGNGIDPLLMCDKFGADALRFSLLIQAGSGRDVLMGESRVESYRNFITKIWNAARFCEMNGAVFGADLTPTEVLQPVNKWILTKSSETAKEIEKALDVYAFNDASNALYHFIWGTFCDWYLEAIKPIFYGADEQAIAETRKVAGFVLESLLKMAHPFIPFVTEEIWDKTANRPQMLAQMAWPDLTAFQDEKAAADFEKVIEFVGALRSARVEVNVPPSAKITVYLKEADEAEWRLFRANEATLFALARIEKMAPAPAENLTGAITLVVGKMTVLIPLTGLIDIPKEKERLNKEIANLAGFAERLKTQLANKAFVDKAPAAVIEDKKIKLTETEVALKKLQETLAKLG
ncbi:MAG: valine--tRNA ligase [Alphaproteobacteria bacterium]